MAGCCVTSSGGVRGGGVVSAGGVSVLGGSTFGASVFGVSVLGVSVFGGVFIVRDGGASLFAGVCLLPLEVPNGLLILGGASCANAGFATAAAMITNTVLVSPTRKFLVFMRFCFLFLCFIVTFSAFVCKAITRFYFLLLRRIFLPPQRPVPIPKLYMSHSGPVFVMERGAYEAAAGYKEDSSSI